MTTLDVATLNIRNMADRWPERLPLLLADMAALQPDVLGLQEVVYPMQQDRLIGGAGEGQYGIFRGWAGRPEYGNSLLVKAPLSGGDFGRLDLGRSRSVLRVIVTIEERRALFAVTHLHHVGDAAAERDAQAADLLRWLAEAPESDAQIVMGDFNAHPAEHAAERMRSHGFRSAFAEANGHEPPVTWPSGIQAPGMDTDGDPACLDYIWVRGPVRVDAARLAFDRPHPDDLTLFPSDHFGISALLRIEPADRSADR
jgi:endonuclease/exonuclease/phosphatase family metal-dependent hydrolase